MAKKIYYAMAFLLFLSHDSYAMKFSKILNFFNVKKNNSLKSDQFLLKGPEENALKIMQKYFLGNSEDGNFSAGTKKVLLISQCLIDSNIDGICGTKITSGIVEIDKFLNKSPLGDICSEVHKRGLGFYMIPWSVSMCIGKNRDQGLDCLIQYLDLFKNSGAIVTGIVLDLSEFSSCSSCKKMIECNYQDNNDNDKLNPCILERFIHTFRQKLEKASIDARIIAFSPKKMNLLMMLVRQI